MRSVSRLGSLNLAFALAAASTLGPPSVVIEKDVGVDAEVAWNQKAIHVVQKTINETRRTVDFVASSDTLDAHGDVVDQESWQLGDFLENPVILFAHNSRELPIGRAIRCEVVTNGTRKQLECTVEFATAEMNPTAEQVFKIIVGGFLKAVSVGFVPMNGRYEVRDGDECWVWSGCVLKEISVTPIGANPDALAKVKAKAIALAKETAPVEPATNPALVADPQPKENRSMMTAEEKAAFEAAKTEKLEAQLATKTAESALATEKTKATALEAEVKTLRAENVVLDGQTKKLAEERDSAVKAKDDVEAKLIENEVEALVGVKIAVEEKADYVELRKTNKPLFEKIIAQRNPLGGKANLVNEKGQGETVISGKNETASNPAPIDTKGVGASIADAAMKLGEKELGFEA